MMISAVEYASDVLDMGDAGRLEAVFRPWIMSLDDILYFAVLRENGQVISASQDDWADKPFDTKKIAHLESNQDIELTKIFFAGVHTQELHFRQGYSVDGTSIEQASAVIRRHNNDLGHLIIGFNNQTLRSYQTTILFIAVAPFIIFFLLASLLLGRLLTPISRFIDSSVKELSRLPASGGKAELLSAVEFMNFDHQHHGIDEFSRLSQALHRFKSTLEKSLYEIKELTHENVEMLRFKAVSDSAQMIAHDIKKPFAMMRALLQVHDQSRNVFDHMMKQSRSSLEQAMTAGESLVQNLYEIGQDDLLNSTVTTLDALIEPSLRLNQILLTKVQSVNINWQHKSLVCVDPSKIIRVIENILGNAIRAVNSGGSIWISSKELVNTQAGWIQVIIGNSGSYISSERRSTIFSTFATGKKADGWGLGLAIAKRFVEMHRGEIGCTSNDHGTEFFFTLPIA